MKGFPGKLKKGVTGCMRGKDDRIRQVSASGETVLAETGSGKVWREACQDKGKRG